MTLSFTLVTWVERCTVSEEDWSKSLEMTTLPWLQLLGLGPTLERCEFCYMSFSLHLILKGKCKGDLVFLVSTES